MSNLTNDQTALLTVVEAVLEDYFADLPIALSADASKELKRLYAYIAKRKNPAPPRTRKPKQAALPVATASEPIAHYEPSGEYKNPNSKRGRRG